jgi:hypothetical protein
VYENRSVFGFESTKQQLKSIGQPKSNNLGIVFCKKALPSMTLQPMLKLLDGSFLSDSWKELKLGDGLTDQRKARKRKGLMEMYGQ